MDIVAARFIGAGIAVIALFGVGLGLGKLFAAVVDAMARNPEVKDEINSKAMLYFALIESIALLAFIVAMLILTGK